MAARVEIGVSATDARHTSAGMSSPHWNEGEEGGPDSDGEPELLTLTAGRDEFVSRLRREERAAPKKKRKRKQAPKLAPEREDLRGVRGDGLGRSTGGSEVPTGPGQKGEGNLDGGSEAASNANQLPQEVVEMVISRASG